MKTHPKPTGKRSLQQTSLTRKCVQNMWRTPTVSTGEKTQNQASNDSGKKTLHFVGDAPPPQADKNRCSWDVGPETTALTLTGHHLMCACLTSRLRYSKQTLPHVHTGNTRVMHTAPSIRTNAGEPPTPPPTVQPTTRDMGARNTSAVRINEFIATQDYRGQKSATELRKASGWASRVVLFIQSFNIQAKL